MGLILRSSKNKRNKSSRIKLILILLIPIGFILNKILHSYPHFTEKFYSKGFYKVISRLISFLTGWIKFSVAELLLIALSLFITFCLILFITRIIKRKKERFYIIRKTIINTLAAVGLLYFSFLLLWGFNYNRLSLAEIFELDVSAASTAELRNTAEIIISYANDLRSEVSEDSRGVMAPKNGMEGALTRAEMGYSIASKEYTQIGAPYGLPKPIKFSYYMSYSNIWGVFCPWTAEANVNTEIPLPMVPSTIAHEMAHQLGFAREDEANYIAYLVCTKHPDDDFRYSGLLLALTYVMDSLYTYDREAYGQLYKSLHSGIIRDFNSISEFNKRFDSPAGEFFSKTNDLYLKANNQPDGERSYGRMVDLLIGEYRKKANLFK